MLSTEELVDTADTLKVIIVSALLNDGIIKDKKAADEWCSKHSVIIRKKSMFRDLFGKWSKEKETTDGVFFVVVKS
jgi:hypothetical protein